MWAANVILTGVGLVLLVRMGREGATSRGGDLSEFIDGLRARLREDRPPDRIRTERRHRTDMMQAPAPIPRPLRVRRVLEDLRDDGARVSGALIIIDLTDNLDKYLNRQLPQRADRAQLSVLDPGFDVHGAAGRGAVRDGVLDRRVDAALRDHGGEGVGDQLLPADAPIFVGAIFAAGLAVGLGELVPITNKRRPSCSRRRSSARAAIATTSRSPRNAAACTRSAP